MGSSLVGRRNNDLNVRPPRGTLSPYLCAAALACLIQAGGCARVTRFESSDAARWSGLGLSLRLPSGAWEVEEVDPGAVVEFRRRDATAHVVLLRLRSRSDEPGFLAIKRLFADFREKRELRRESRTLPSGPTAEIAEYDVTLEDRTIRVRACVVRRGTLTYELVAWGLDAAAADAVADSLLFDGQGP